MLITLKTKFRKGFFQHLEKLKKSAIEKKKRKAQQRYTGENQKLPVGKAEKM